MLVCDAAPRPFFTHEKENKALKGKRGRDVEKVERQLDSSHAHSLE